MFAPGTAPCSAGRYSTGSEDECLTCNTGSYSSSSASFCATVLAGSKATKDGEMRIGTGLCPAGRYSTGSVDVCSSCTGATFSFPEGSSVCE